MSNEESVEGESTSGAGRKEKMTQVPLERLQEYLDRMKPGLACGFCKNGTYKAVPAPKGDTAGLIATPSANIKKVGAWFYPATCNRCGDTRFFHAPQAYQAMAKEHGWADL